MFPNLAQPIKIGKLELPNRMITAPVVSNLASEEGAATERLIDFYRALGRGGWGWVMVGASYIDGNYKMFNQMQGIYSDLLIGGLADQADAIKEGGCLAGIQIMHPGLQSSFNKVPPIAPSEIVGRLGNVVRAMTAEEVEKTIDQYAAAALRAKKAGFDLVLFHGTHNFLIHQFTSPRINKRDDKWGEPSAYVTEMIRRTRKAVGADYTIGIRVSGAESTEEGDPYQQVILKLAPLMVEAGVDYFEVSIGGRPGGRGPTAIPSYYTPRGCLVPLAEAIKKVVSVPVGAVCRIRDPFMAEDIVAQGRADLIAFARGSIADHELAKKALEGRVDEIRRCISCIRCQNRMTVPPDGPIPFGLAGSGARCTVNYAMARFKSEYEIRPAVTPKKVMVVGGGPAGMEAARVAAQRGHKITLYEKQSELGGQLTAASAPPYKHELTWLTYYLVNQLEKNAIPVKLGTEVTPELVETEKPDAVILATGSMNMIPEIPGVSTNKVVTAIDVLLGKVNVGEKIVIIGGELVGCETADFLAERDKKVTVVRRGAEMATRMIPSIRLELLNRLQNKGVVLLTGIKKYETITEEGVVITDGKGKQQTLEADTVVLAAGAIPDNKLAKSIKGKVSEVYRIGDCVQPSDVMNAIHTANRVAREV